MLPGAASRSPVFPAGRADPRCCTGRNLVWGGEAKVLAYQNLIKDLTLKLGAALVSHWRCKTQQLLWVGGERDADVSRYEWKKGNKHMENVSKIPPGNTEKARLAPLRARLVRHLSDRASESRRGVTQVCAVTWQDLQLRDLVIQKQFIDVLWALGRFSFYEFIRLLKTRWRFAVVSKLCCQAPLALFWNQPCVVLAGSCIGNNNKVWCCLWVSPAFL